MSPLPTKLLMSWEDIGTDHPDVPALLSNPIFVSGNRLSQEPACQFFKQFFGPNSNFRTSSQRQVGTIWLSWMYSSLGKGLLPIFPFCTGYGDGSFLILCRASSPTHLSGVIGVFLHVRCIPQQKLQWQFWASVCYRYFIHMHNVTNMNEQFRTSKGTEIGPATWRLIWYSRAVWIVHGSYRINIFCSSGRWSVLCVKLLIKNTAQNPRSMQGRAKRRKCRKGAPLIWPELWLVCCSILTIAISSVAFQGICTSRS